MRVGAPSIGIRAVCARGRPLRATGSGWIIALCCALSVCLSVACSHTAEVEYLDADEIRQSIVGNSLRETGSGDWREDFLPADRERLKGIIRGHEKPPGGLYEGTWAIVGDSMCIEYPEIPEQDDCYRFARGDRREIIWLGSDGAVAHESELVERADAESAAFEFRAPAFRHETIAFRHGENRIVGDLGLPEVAPPYPAVVFVHGSGPASRHQYFLDLIANEFLRRGFATLIWSKPGVDESTGDYLKQTMADRAAEVASAIAYLAERGDIDPDRIGLWGISQAGWVMPMVPAHRSIAFVVSVSGCARTGQEQDLFGVENELVRIGFSDEELADALEHRREFYDLVRESADYADFSTRHETWLAEMKSRAWYPLLESRLDELVFQNEALSMGPGLYQFFKINDVDGSLIAPPELKNLDMPVLAIYGSDDALVDAQLGASAYREIPRLNGNPDVTVVVFDGADHAVMQPDADGYLEFAPGFLTTMGDWLEAHR